MRVRRLPAPVGARASRTRQPGRRRRGCRHHLGGGDQARNARRGWTPDTLSTRWTDPHSAAVFDGFHAAALYDRHVGLRVGADLLGLFPVYYWSSGDVILVGSSPELFRHHPDFRMKLSPAGLVGILLTVSSGRRTDAPRGRAATGGRIAARLPERIATTEVSRYRLPVSRRYFDRPFSEHLDVLGPRRSNARPRITPVVKTGTRCCCREGSIPGCWGLPGTPRHRRRGPDDWTAARLGNDRCQARGERPRVPAPDGRCPFEQYPLYADLQTQWEHLANGFSTIRIMGACRRCCKLYRPGSSPGM